MIEFHSHFSGSGGNLYTITDGDALLGIECGVPIDKLIKALRFKPHKASAFLVSHQHQDHCKAAKALLNLGVPVRASYETLVAILGGEAGNSHTLNKLTLKPYADHVIGDWEVQPFPLIHDCPGHFGFLVRGPSRELLVFASDTQYLPARFPAPTIFACEANYDPDLMRANAASGEIDMARFKRVCDTHMSLPTLLDLLAVNDMTKCRAIFLLHLSGENSNAEDFKARVAAATGIPTYICDK